MTENTKVRESHMIGKAGEHLVAAELLSRGVVPAWPSHDEGCDLITMDGCRLQVKTSRSRKTSALRENVYTFHFKHRSFTAHSAKRVVEKPKRILSSRSDYIVLVGWDERRFWIVPTTILDDIHCAYVGPSSVRDFEKDIPEMLEMASLGFSQKDIGQYYGINQASVYERLKAAGTPKAYKKFMGALRICENAWHHIIDFNTPAVQAPVTIPEISSQDQEA
jgi:hypothetical protein